MCIDINTLSPQALIESNDYVLLGEPVSVDTLADLGTLEYLGAEEVAYIIEYTYKPQEIIKGEQSPDYFYLWYCVSINQKDGYYDAPHVDTSTELIYGNDIMSWDSVVYLYTQNLGSAGGIEGLRDWVKGNPPETLWAAAEGDSTLMARIMATTHLESILAQRNRTGQVIYATEHCYWTHDSYHDGELAYCDCFWCIPHMFVSRSDYVEKLRSLAR